VHNGPIRIEFPMLADRHEALQDLLSLRQPLPAAIEAVKKYPWDSDVALVTMTRTDALRLLDAFTSGRLTAGECEAWANAVEGRDDIDLEEGAEAVLKDFLFELATPEASRALTHDTAAAWRQRLTPT
jgi:hypothetical protein